MMKQQLNVRISGITREQITQIAQGQSMTEGEVVALAVERLWQQLNKVQAENICPVPGRMWHVMERDDGSICVYFTKPDSPAQWIVWDSLDQNASPVQGRAERKR